MFLRRPALLLFTISVLRRKGGVGSLPVSLWGSDTVWGRLLSLVGLAVPVSQGAELSRGGGRGPHTGSPNFPPRANSGCLPSEQHLHPAAASTRGGGLLTVCSYTRQRDALRGFVSLGPGPGPGTRERAPSLARRPGPGSHSPLLEMFAPPTASAARLPGAPISSFHFIHFDEFPNGIF